MAPLSRLNPYSNGIYSIRLMIAYGTTSMVCLNPYSNGIYSISEVDGYRYENTGYVLILILMEYTL